MQQIRRWIQFFLKQRLSPSLSFSIFHPKALKDLTDTAVSPSNNVKGQQRHLWGILNFHKIFLNCWFWGYSPVGRNTTCQTRGHSSRNNHWLESEGPKQQQQKTTQNPKTLSKEWKSSFILSRNEILKYHFLDLRKQEDVSSFLSQWQHLSLGRHEELWYFLALWLQLHVSNWTGLMSLISWTLMGEILAIRSMGNLFQLLWTIYLHYAFQPCGSTSCWRNFPATFPTHFPCPHIHVCPLKLWEHFFLQIFRSHND